MTRIYGLKQQEVIYLSRILAGCTKIMILDLMDKICFLVKRTEQMSTQPMVNPEPEKKAEPAVQRLRKAYTNQKFYDENFFGKDLSHADFRGCTLFNCNFDNSDLGYANFEGANCYKSTFVGSRLYHTNFRNAVLAGTVLKPRDA